MRTPKKTFFLFLVCKQKMFNGMGKVIDLPHFPRFIPPYQSMASIGFWTIPGLDESDSWLLATRQKMTRLNNGLTKGSAGSERLIVRRF